MTMPKRKWGRMNPHNGTAALHALGDDRS